MRAAQVSSGAAGPEQDLTYGVFADQKRSGLPIFKHKVAYQLLRTSKVIRGSPTEVHEKGPLMIRFARFAYYTLFRDAGFFGLIAALLMLAFSFSLPAAFDAAGVTMLAFAIVLLVRATFLTEQRFERSEAWRALDDDEKPQGYDGLIWAREELRTMMLRFAKTAAGLSGLLFSSALVVSVA